MYNPLCSAYKIVEVKNEEVIYFLKILEHKETFQGDKTVYFVQKKYLR